MTPTSAGLDLSRLMGFETMRVKARRRVDFRDDSASGPVGAKIGPPEPVAPVISYADE